MERCNVISCTHSDDDELIICETCRQKTCNTHARQYSGYALCRSCQDKENTVIATSILATYRVIDTVALCDLSAEQMAERLMEIVKKLSNWDAGIILPTADLPAAVAGPQPCVELVTVPRNPTKEMLDAAYDDALAESAIGVWSTMIDQYEGKMVHSQQHGWMHPEDLPANKS